MSRSRGRPPGRRRPRQIRTPTRNQAPLPIQSKSRLGQIVRSAFYPYWKLLVEFAGVGAAAFGVYIGFVTAVPEIHLATQSSTSPVEYGFYIQETSPIIAAHITRLICGIVYYKDINNNIQKDTKTESPINLVLNRENRQLFYRCPIHLGIPLQNIETNVTVVYYWNVFGVDIWRERSTTSLIFTWPAGAYNRQWREG